MYSVRCLQQPPALPQDELRELFSPASESRSLVHNSLGSPTGKDLDGTMYLLPGEQLGACDDCLNGSDQLTMAFVRETDNSKSS